MDFKLKKPCKGCPFRKDCLPGWLGKERAQEIANSVILGDGGFPCHKTVNYEAWNEEEEEEYFYKGGEQFCAGALALEQKANEGGNLSIRLGRMFKGFKYSDLKDKDVIFESVQQFIKHHSK